MRRVLSLAAGAAAIAVGAAADCGDTTPVYVPDVSLRAMLKELAAIDSSVIRADDLCGIVTIDAQYSGVEDFTGLEYCTALETLILPGCGVTDLSPLAGLANLRLVALEQSPVADLSPLGGLPDLEELRLRDTEVTDLSPLATVPTLRTLDIDRTRVQSLEPLGGGMLTKLYADDTWITSIDALAGLSLQELHINNTLVGDLAVLEAMSALRQVYINNTLVYSLAPLLNNLDFATGDTLSCQGAPLSADGRCDDAQAIEARGASVYGEPACIAFDTNNSCFSPVPIVVGERVGGDSTGANGSDVTPDCGTNDTRDVWFSIVAEADGELIADTSGSAFDTTLGLFTACNAPALECNDNFRSGATVSRISWQAEAGQSYLLRLSGAGASQGRYLLSVTSGICGSTTAVTVPDPDLEHLLRVASKRFTGPLRENDLCKVTALTLVGKKYSDLTGLAFCVNLRKLHLNSTSVSDLDPIAGLTQIRDFLSYSSSFSELSALANNDHLESVVLSNNGVLSLEGLEGKQHLQRFEIDSEPIDDIGPLSGLAALERVKISLCPLEDLAALGACPALTEVDVTYCKVTDAGALSGLQQLESLSLSGNAITSLGNLGNLPKLEQLSINDNLLTTIPVLSGLGMLHTVLANGNLIASVPGLSLLPSLTHVFLDGNPLHSAALGLFQNLPGIKVVSVNESNVTSIDPFVANMNFAAQDVLSVNGCPLSAKAACTDIAVLEDRGALVAFSGTPCKTATIVDKCVDALNLPVGGRLYGSLTGATGADVSSCGDLPDTNDVWYKVSVDAPTPASIATCGSAFDTQLAVFDACNGEELACDDDSCGDQERISILLAPGIDYRVRVSGYGNASGDYVLSCALEPCAGDTAIQLPDAALAAVVRQEAGIGAGAILASDVCPFTYLNLSSRGITDITGLRHFTRLAIATLSNNPGLSDLSELALMPNLKNIEVRESLVDDLSPLAALTRLAIVDIRQTQVSDLLPLLDNPAFGAGDTLFAAGCPLTSEALCVQVPALQARGVTVHTEGAVCQPAAATDACAGTPLSLVAQVPAGGWLDGATLDSAASCDEAAAPDVWAVFLADSGGAYTFDVCDSDMPIDVSVLEGCGGAEVFCATDAALCGANPPTFEAAQGEVLMVRIASTASGAGAFSVVVVPAGMGSGTGILRADQNGDSVLELSELLRVVQFFHAGGIHCAAAPEDTEDGYVPGPGSDTSCQPYDLDYGPKDWVVGLSELLRAVQFFNLLGYHACPEAGTEDGYCPGLE